MSRLAHCYLLEGLVDKAFALHGEILAQRPMLEAKSPRVLGIALSRYGAPLTGMGRNEEAEQALVEAQTLLEGATTTEPSDLRINLERIVELYEKWGKPDRAAEWRSRKEPPS